MVLPVGFGGIFPGLNILLKNLREWSGQHPAGQVTYGDVTASYWHGLQACSLPYFSGYRKPRGTKKTELTVCSPSSERNRQKHVGIAAVGIVVNHVQLYDRFNDHRCISWFYGVYIPAVLSLGKRDA